MTLFLTINEILKWLSLTLLWILMQEPFWCSQCSVRYCLPLPPPPGISVPTQYQCLFRDNLALIEFNQPYYREETMHVIYASWMWAYTCIWVQHASTRSGQAFLLKCLYAWKPEDDVWWRLILYIIMYALSFYYHFMNYQTEIVMIFCCFLTASWLGLVFTIASDFYLSNCFTHSNKYCRQF